MILQQAEAAAATVIDVSMPADHLRAALAQKKAGQQALEVLRPILYPEDD